MASTRDKAVGSAVYVTKQLGEAKLRVQPPWELSLVATERQALQTSLAVCSHNLVRPRRKLSNTAQLLHTLRGARSLPADRTAVDRERAVGRMGFPRPECQRIPVLLNSTSAPAQIRAARRLRERATQPHASYIDDERRRAGHGRTLSQSEKACFPLAFDLVRPYRGNRESGRRDSS
jgi:hypothetical protein